MIAPKQISVTINGKRCVGQEGETILQVAQANEIYIPTLCHLKHLSPWGGCRLCIVEIAGSQKVVPDLETARRRIREYVYPLEDERMQKASGAHSAINQILIINGDRLGRITVVLIDEIVGF